MGGDFEIKSRYHLYINEETKERMREIEDHLKNNYQGIGDFVEKKMHEEQALNIEERIRRKEQNIKEEKEQLEQLKQVNRERNVQDKLRDKRELLQKKQEELSNVQKHGLKSREEIVEEELDKRSKYDVSREDDVVQRAVEKRLEERPDVDELVESVQRLQRQVAELNGGEEDYFMDLGDVEVAQVESA